MIGCKLEGLWNQVSHSWTELQAEETLLPGRPAEYKVLLNISWICFKDQRKKNGTEKIQSAGIQVRQVTLSSTCTFPAEQEVHSILRCLKILNITAVMELGAECEDNRCVTKDWLYPAKRGCVCQRVVKWTTVVVRWVKMEINGNKTKSFHGFLRCLRTKKLTLNKLRASKKPWNWQNKNDSRYYFSLLSHYYNNVGSQWNQKQQKMQIFQMSLIQVHNQTHEKYWWKSPRMNVIQFLTKCC